MKNNKTVLSLCFCTVLTFTTLKAQDTIPPMNRTIVEYVSTVIGKKVDRGECWDLANQALKRVDAKWDLKFKYGKLLDPKKDTIYPGDIIQFKNVLVEYKTEIEGGTQISRETMGQHTAIVFKVNAPGDFQLAHQNTEFSGRKVGVSRFVLKNIKRGKIWIYRPEK
jgi:hypothetical protein